jgi:hypothetical protein
MGKQPRRCRECGEPISRGNKSGYCRSCYGRFVLHFAGIAKKLNRTKEILIAQTSSNPQRKSRKEERNL